MIVIESEHAFLNLMKRAFAEFIGTSITTLPDLNVVKQEWITTPVFKVHLKDKGYSATSSVTIKKIATNFSIRTEKRGRDLWFNLSDVLSIPSKI